MNICVRIKPLYEGKFIVRVKIKKEEFLIFENLDEVLHFLRKINWFPEDPLKDAYINKENKDAKGG